MKELVFTIDAKGEESIRTINELNAKIKELTKLRATEYKVGSEGYNKMTKELANLKSKKQDVIKVDREAIKTLKSEENSINSLRQSVRKNTEAYNNMSKARRQGAEGQELKKAIKAEKEELASLSEELGNYQHNVGNYKSALEDIQKQMLDGVPANVAFANTFEGIKKSSVGALKALRAFIASPIGVTITALAGIGIATKAWLDYNDKLAESQRLMQQFTGYTGRDLQVATSQTESFAKQAEADLGEVARAVKATQEAFGLDYLEALEKVEQGYVRGGEAADDFFNNAQEYASQFANAGYSADEFYSILEQGAKKGIYQDKLIDSIKEVDLRLKEFTNSTSEALTNAFGQDFSDKIGQGVASGEITTKEALQQIIAEADKVGLNFQQKQTLIADVFSAAGEDAGGFAKIVEAINEGLNDTNRELTALEQAQQDEINATQELKSSFDALFGVTDGGLKAMILNAKVFVTKYLVGMIKGVINFRNYFADLYNNSLSLRASFETISGITTTVFRLLYNQIKIVRNGFVGLGKVILSLFTFDKNKIASAISETLEDFSAGVSNISDIVSEQWDKAVKNIESKKIKPIKIPTEIDIKEALDQKEIDNILSSIQQVIGSTLPKEEKIKVLEKAYQDLVRLGVDPANQALVNITKQIDILKSKNTSNNSTSSNLAENQTKDQSNKATKPPERYEDKYNKGGLGTIKGNDTDEVTGANSKVDDIYAKNKEQIKDLYDFKEEKRQEDLAREMEAKQRQLDIQEQLTAGMSDAFSALFSGAEEGAEQFGKVMLATLFEIAEKEILVNSVRALANEIGGKGIVGIATGAVVQGVIFGAWNAIKGKILGSFAEGGYTGDGYYRDDSGHKVAGVVHDGEWVGAKWQVQKHPEIFNTLEAERKRGYSGGGFTSPMVIQPSTNVNATANIEHSQMIKQAEIMATKISQEVRQSVSDVVAKSYSAIQRQVDREIRAIKNSN